MKLLKKYKFVAIFFSILLLIGATYYKLFATFYQQDEWWLLGQIVSREFFHYISKYYSFLNFFVGGRPLSIPIQFVFYKFLPFQIWPFVIFSLIGHYINSILLFCITYKLTKNTFLSFFASLFFALGSAGEQAVIWAGAITTTIPATTFGLLSLLSYVEYIQKNKKKWIISCFIFFLIASLFKESSFFIPLLLPVLYLGWKEKKSIKDFIQTHILFLFEIIFLVVVVMLRVFALHNQGGKIVTAGASPFAKLLFHSVTHPLTSFSQLFINGNFLYPLAEKFLHANYLSLWDSPYRASLQENIAADFLAIIASTLLILFIGVIIVVNRKYQRILLFGLIFSLASFLPYIVFDKSSSYLEGRFYYLGMAGAGILFASIITWLREMCVKRYIIVRYCATITVIVIASYFLWMQSQFIQQDINQQVVFATERLSFLHQLHALVPELPNNPVFVIQGDTNYYIANNPVPFQQGMGFTLMVWYYGTGKIPSRLIGDEFLWQLGGQAYKRIGSKGFGYFNDLNLVKKQLMTKKISTNQLIGLYYTGSTHKLTDSTDRIKKQLH